MLPDVFVVALGSALLILGLLMAANRAGYVVFVVTPRSAMVVAAALALVFVAVKLSLGR